MSRSLHFAPVAPPPPSTGLGGAGVKSLFLDAFGPGCETGTGDEAFRLTPGDLPAVRALLNAEEGRLRRWRAGRTGGQGNDLAEAAMTDTVQALQDVADALQEHGELRFWLE